MDLFRARTVLLCAAALSLPWTAGGCTATAGSETVPGASLDVPERREALVALGLLSRFYLWPEEIPAKETVWNVQDALAPVTDRWTWYSEPVAAEKAREEEENPVIAPSGDPVPTVYVARADSGISYLLVSQFKRVTMEKVESDTSGTWLEFRKALRATAGDVATILDLRGNPGGNVDVCLGMADELVPGGKTLVYEEDAVGPWFGLPLRRAYASSGGGLGESRRYVYLVDGGSASCAEIFVAAARGNRPQDLVVGRRSYGKGIGQSIWNTPLGGLLRVTSLRFFGPDGVSWHRRGVEPDVEVSGSADQLARALVEARKMLYRASPSAPAPSAAAGQAPSDSALRAFAALPAAAVPAIGTVAETAVADGAAVLEALERRLAAETADRAFPGAREEVD